jgi:hypothetical protein
MMVQRVLGWSEVDQGTQTVFSQVRNKGGGQGGELSLI